ncbi:D-aminoacyl-tRNA deacylase [Uliginosibacterium sp. H3]|uniref:D-aminoacyl-tRNA deacylase n=1 Tax=Uliginosibacterium silvisoli TaxID=3114758 RepID=A0ABU6K7P7_9RHOO|nr:D-aminoacyl-tRNA deacylase [Uliginosibacterium sp. H3]
MIALIQRVSEAAVRVESEIVGAIETGLLALVAVQPGDTTEKADRLLEKMLNYRVFSDDTGRMNRSLRDTQGGLLLVSQFTLAADTTKGTRASFTSAAAPDVAAERFDYLVSTARQTHPDVACGRFGADMKVSLVNDGPVTFWLEV